MGEREQYRPVVTDPGVPTAAARVRLSRRSFLAGSLAGLGSAASGFATAAAELRRYGIAMHGEPALPHDFPHLPYVNPRAPQGGRMTIGVIGSFDSLNPYIVRGQAAGDVQTYIYEALMARSFDEPFSLYGRIAESVELPDEREWITYHLDPRAHFSDGRSIGVEDVLFSLDLLKRKGWPNLRNYYSKVEKAEQIGERSLRLSFPQARDRELPLIMSLLPVLPKHAIDAETFDQTTLTPPIGSGPYKVGDVDVGRSITYVKDRDWWARDTPFATGLYNFAEVRVEYFRDDNSMYEAVKKGIIDLRPEDNPTRWINGYDFPAALEGRVVKEAFSSGLPKPMFALAFNCRRPLLADRNVRLGLTALFDFEWVNANLFAGTYKRTNSFFEGSELSSVGRAADARERALLQPFLAQIPDDVIEGRWRAPRTDGSGFDRAVIRQALAYLAKAGYENRDGRLRAANGEPLAIEAMINLHEHERLLLAWKRVLDRVGIELRIRFIDSAQFERRRQNYDYDLIPWSWGASLSPGNEQGFRWGSQVADQPGSFNLAGVKDQAVDAMVAGLLKARTRQELVDTARALDRALIAGAYVLPLYHLPERRVVRSSALEHVEKTPLFGPIFDSWWRKPDSP